MLAGHFKAEVCIGAKLESVEEGRLRLSRVNSYQVSYDLLKACVMNNDTKTELDSNYWY